MPKLMEYFPVPTLLPCPLHYSDRLRPDPSYAPIQILRAVECCRPTLPKSTRAALLGPGAAPLRPGVIRLLCPMVPLGPAAGLDTAGNGQARVVCSVIMGGSGLRWLTGASAGASAGASSARSSRLEFRW
jgi:hypothetical protein